MADVVLRERQGHVEVLTINRPEARNAINGPVSLAMSGFMDELAEDPDCWVVVVTGSGDKAFSAGMDLKAFSSGEGGDIIGAKGGFAGLTQREVAKPIIAAVNGSALAGGFEIMLSCDLVVTADHAKFGIPEAKRGLVAGAGGLDHVDVRGGLRTRRRRGDDHEPDDRAPDPPRPGGGRQWAVRHHQHRRCGEEPDARVGEGPGRADGVHHRPLTQLPDGAR